MEAIGNLAREWYQKPDAGPIGAPTEKDYKLQSFSVAMCWSACDRLGTVIRLLATQHATDVLVARIGKKLGVEDGYPKWTAAAAEISKFFVETFWNAQLSSFVSVAGTDQVR